MKKVLICCLLIAVTFSAHAQWAWTLNGIGNSWDRGNAVSTDPSGNVFLAGNYASDSLTFGGVTLVHGSFSVDLFLVKFDALGNALWGRSIGGTGQDYVTSLSADDSGNVYIAGYFTSSSLTFGSYTLNNAGSYAEDIFLAKYDATGSVVWARSIGGYYSDIAYSVSAGAAGVALAGYWDNGWLTVDSTTLHTAGMEDMLVALFDPAGTVKWAKSIGESMPDYASAVHLDDAGNVYCAGYYYSSSITPGTMSYTNAGGYDILLLKYDSFGNLMHARSIGGTGVDEPYALATDSSGNVYLAGFFASPTINFGLTTLNNVGYRDWFLAKFDSTLLELWSLSAGGANGEEANGVCVRSDQSVFITGTFQSPVMTLGSFVLNNAGGLHEDMFLAGYDAGGTALVAESAGGFNADFSSGIATDGAAVYACGFFNDSISFGSHTLLDTLPYSDAFLVKYVPVISATQNLGNRESFMAYPNPVASGASLFFRFTEQQDPFQLTILNVAGQVMRATTISSGQSITSPLPSGVYILQARNERGIHYAKLVVN